MDEAGFIIDQLLKDCRKQTDDLKKEKDCLNQHKYAFDIKKSKNDQLRKDADAAKREFAETLQEELKDQSDDDEGAEINTTRILMQIQKDDNIPEFKKGCRVVKEEPVVYEEEIENLPKQICDKYHNLVGIVHKLHKANAEEEAAVRVLNSYIANQEETNGSLIKRVHKVNHRNSRFKALEI